MSLNALVEIIQSGNNENWNQRNKEAFDSLFGAPSGRYPKNARDEIVLRAPEMQGEAGVPFAAYIHHDNPTSGAFSGLSFTVFPVAEGPCLIGLGVGTQGLGQDEAILGRPGHARKLRAIADWLNNKFGQGNRVAWAKTDPTRTDIKIPDGIQHEWSRYSSVFKRYGGEMYALYAPTADSNATRDAVASLLDLMMWERGHSPLVGSAADAEALRSTWFQYLLPETAQPFVEQLLGQRRFVILQGPPGTGKTRLARLILKEKYKQCGLTIQFHPNTTYESFIGGLEPIHASDALGLQFKPAPGHLMKAAQSARANPSKNFLLHIDEINRADLAKILGEAIMLLEVNAEDKRAVELPYDFGEPYHRSLELPENLHILGTMNSSDRSIAMVDVAIRRRFGFVSVWPDWQVVNKHGGDLMQRAFKDLMEIFIEYAGDDAFQLLPGHAYFLVKDDAEAALALKTNLLPLLDEYVAQGYVGSFAESIRTYSQWLQNL